MENKQVVYFVTGLAGIGKTSHVRRICEGKKNLLLLSTDNVRLHRIVKYRDESRVFKESDLEKVLNLNTDSERKLDGFDGLTALGFIKFHSIFSNLKKDMLIDTVAFTDPYDIQRLENEPGINIKAAFMGCSKKVSRVEKRNVYSNFQPINEGQIDQSNGFKSKIDRLRQQGFLNYQYFDLMEKVPIEKQNLQSEPLGLGEEYFKENAEAVVGWLFEG